MRGDGTRRELNPHQRVGQTGPDGPKEQRRGIFPCPEWLFYAKHD